MCRVQDFLFVLGGEGGHYGPDCDILSDVWRFDMQRMIWTEVSTSGEPPRVSRAACALLNGTTIIICGGFDGMFNTSDVYGLNLRTNVWTKYQIMGDVPAGGFCHHTANVLPEGRILIVLTRSGCRNCEFFELLIHHDAPKAIYRRIAGIELKTELLEQKLKVGSVIGALWVLCRPN